MYGAAQSPTRLLQKSASELVESVAGKASPDYRSGFLSHRDQLLQSSPRCRTELRITSCNPASLHRRKWHAPSAARWIVLDPVARKCFRIGWLEHWFLTRLDGNYTLRQLILRFRNEQPDSLATDSQILTIIEQFFEAHLLTGLKRPLAANRSQWSAWISSFVFWRLRGVQPDRFLQRVAPHTDVLFSRPAVTFWLCAAVVVGTLVALNFHRLATQTHIWQWITQPSSGGMLLAVLLVTRALHELGHAIVCRRFGIRCPDIGVFFILGAPCVYCDVSESWTLPNRWQRAAVAAAGMYTELIVATLAGLFWLFTVDSVWNLIALQTMLVCSVSTLLINANPLMRFDGYHLLADVCDETNLRAKCDQLALQTVRTIVLGSRYETPLLSPARQTAYKLFSIAGWCYRLVLSATIASVLMTIYAGWNLTWMGRFVAIAILFSWWVLPTINFTRSLLKEAHRPMQKIRLGMFAAAAAMLFLFFPIPVRRVAQGWTQPRSTQGVFAPHDAQLSACYVADGVSVQPGQRLFRLVNPAMETKCIEKNQLVELAIVERDTKQRLRDFHSQNIDVGIYENQLASAQTQAASANQALLELNLDAKVDGMFCAAVLPSEAGDGPQQSFSDWTMQQNLGRTVSQGTLLGTICSQASMAVIPLHESQLSDIATGTRVKLFLHETNRALTAEVASVVQFDAVAQQWRVQGEWSPDELAATGASFAAVINLPEDSSHKSGSTIDAAFHVPAQTLASLTTAWLKSNLRLLAD